MHCKSLWRTLQVEELSDLPSQSAVHKERSMEYYKV